MRGVMIGFFAGIYLTAGVIALYFHWLADRSHPGTGRAIFLMAMAVVGVFLTYLAYDAPGDDQE